MRNIREESVRTLNTILALIQKPYHPEGETDTPRIEQMQHRLDEIEEIASKQVVSNAHVNAGA